MKHMLLIGLFCLGLFPFADAALPPAPVEPTATAAALAHFMPEPGPIDLRGAHARAEVAIPIAAGIEPKRLTLHLAATNSVALVAKRSVLRVLLDDHLVAQIPLDPRLPRIEASIELPVYKLKPGYHRLVFDAAQHYTEEHCEDPAAPELWTQIDTRRSWLKLEAGRQEGPFSLAELDRLFDPRRWGPQQLTIATLGAPTPDHVRLGALASQMAALHLRYRPLRVVHRAIEPRLDALAGLMLATDAGAPVLLLGAAQAVTAVLGEAQPVGDGARLRLYPLPDRPMLVVQGTAQEMERALQALLLQRTPLPDRAQAAIGAVVGAPVPPTLPADKPLRLRALGWTDDLEVRGRHGGRTIEFTLPVDFYTPREAFLILRLNLAYGAGLRRDSALNVLANGRFARAVPLAEAGGARYDGYEVRIPLALLQPGPNRLALSADLIPAESGHCVIRADEALRLTVRADSTLTLPPYAQVAAVPDLRLLGRGAYPYAAAPDLGLWLARLDSEHLGAAWTLLARLAQSRGTALPPVRIGIGQMAPEGAGDLILVGSPAQFPPDRLAGAPLRADGRILQGVDTEASEEPASFWQRWLTWLVRGVPAVAARQEPTSVTFQAPLLGRHAALMQWLDEGAGARLLTWLATDHPEHLPSRAHDLVEPAIWSQMQGDIMLWRNADTVHTDRVGGTAMRGGAGWAMRISYLFSQQPIYWASVAVVVLLLAWATRALLLRFKARRHAGVREMEAG